MNDFGLDGSQVASDIHDGGRKMFDETETFNAEAMQKAYNCCVPHCFLTKNGPRGMITSLVDATITFVLNVFAVYTIVVSANQIVHYCEEDADRVANAGFGLDQLKRVYTAVNASGCEDPNPDSIQSNAAVNWFMLSNTRFNTTCQQEDVTCFLDPSLWSPDPATEDYTNWDATHSTTTSGYQCLGNEGSTALPMFLTMAGLTAVLYLMNVILICCSYDHNFGKARFRFNEIAGGVLVRLFTVIPVVFIGVSYMYYFVQALRSCRDAVGNGEECLCPEIGSLEPDWRTTTLFKEGTDTPETCPLEDSACDGVAGQFLQSTLFGLIVYLKSVHGTFKHYRTTLKYQDVKDIEMKESSMMYAVVDCIYPFLHVKENDTIVAEIQELAQKNNIDGDDAQNTFNEQALEKSIWNNIKISSDGRRHLTISVLSATIRLFLNLYAAYAAISAGNIAAHTCPNQRKRLRDAGFGFDLFSVDYGGEDCSDHPGVQTDGPLNWFMIDEQNCSKEGVTCTFKGPPHDENVIDYVNYDATYTLTESNGLCLYPHFGLYIFALLAFMTIFLYVLELIILHCTYTDSYARARLRYNEIMGFKSVKFIVLLPVVIITAAYFFGFYQGFINCSAEAEDGDGLKCPCPKVRSLTSDGLVFPLADGQDGSDECAPTQNDCYNLVNRFITESFFALIFFIGSIHSGFKQYRTTLKTKELDQQGIHFKENAVVAATLDLDYPFLHFKGTDSVIVEAQEAALRRGYSQTPSSGVEMVSQASSLPDGENDRTTI